MLTPRAPASLGGTADSAGPGRVPAGSAAAGPKVAALGVNSPADTKAFLFIEIRIAFDAFNNSVRHQDRLMWWTRVGCGVLAAKSRQFALSGHGVYDSP